LKKLPTDVPSDDECKKYFDNFKKFMVNTLKVSEPGINSNEQIYEKIMYYLKQFKIFISV
jgi:hypothetical protein